MGTKWDYTNLASHYAKRPNYADDAIDRMCEVAGLREGALVCDVGAGTGNLTKMLLDRGLVVIAVEPNDAMMEIGKGVTKGRAVTWAKGTGEDTGQTASSFDMVTFGSSFNTTNRMLALQETARILKPKGWFACMWNHRDLEDPIQNQVEEFIISRLQNYKYGTRRQNQTAIIESSKLFDAVQYSETVHKVVVTKEDYIDAWRSHATLQRQAGSEFENVILGIERLLANYTTLTIPYTTRLWMAQLL